MIFFLTGKKVISLNVKMKKHGKIRIWAVLVWLLVWQSVSMMIGKDILLVSPVKAAVRLSQLCTTLDFWQAIGFSLLRIAGGFVLACLLAIVLASLASRFVHLHEFLTPAMLTIKTVPVASFIILALIWFSSRNLSVLISVLMVLPIVYTNVLEGIRCADRQLLEMARIFRVPTARKIRYILIPQILPFFRAGCNVALGLCWKAGIAAEVIGIPVGSIGEHLQQAKVYLDTPDLFAWTAVIVFLSVALEKAALKLLDGMEKLLERM